MKLSKTFFYSTKEFPKDADIISDKLLRKSNLLVKAHAGGFYFTPILFKVLKKIRNIIVEEMERAGAQEVLLPILMKKELWEESERWDDYISSKLMYSLKNRKDSEMCLGPTHEEAITDLVRKLVTSYKQLPMILFQQNTKFRDEMRPRFGLFRCSEFIMKDAYSFDYTTKGLDESYEIMKTAYKKIFTRCGLNFVNVKADSGAIGGTGSEEFMVLADSGEDTICFCNECDYAANLEKAESVLPEVKFEDYNKDLVKLHTPDIKTVEELVEFTGIASHQMVKTILYKAIWADKVQFVAVLMRGDLEINEIKLKNHLDCLDLTIADAEDVKRLTKSDVGFAGPFNMDESVRIIGDYSIKKIQYFLCGMNETDYHNINVCFDRDLPLPELASLKTARLDDICPVCRKGKIEQKMSIEVGHIFKLGTKYSEKMNATVLNENGKAVPLIMGCYGIGTSRIIAAIIEQCNDEKGILWPESVSPFETMVISMGKDKDILAAAEKFYNRLKDENIDVLFDDRKVSPGFKFKDADLLGIPSRLIFGKNYKDDGKIELELRVDGTKQSMTEDEIIEYLKK